MIIEKVLMPASLTKNFEIWVLQDYEYFPMDGLQSWSMNFIYEQVLQVSKGDEGWWFLAVEGFWFMTDKQTDICECRVTFATENCPIWLQN